MIKCTRCDGEGIDPEQDRLYEEWHAKPRDREVPMPFPCQECWGVCSVETTDEWMDRMRSYGMRSYGIR